MEITKLVNLLCELNNVDDAESNLLFECYATKYKAICEELNCTYEANIHPIIKNIVDINLSLELTAEWKYICLNFYILHLINSELEISGDILSVQQSKSVKDCIKNLIIVGICTKLQPNLPLYIKREELEPSDIFVNYTILKCTVFGLCTFLKLPNLRVLILPGSLKAILVALYQLCYCPLKKPQQSVMTEEMYDKIITERETFTKCLQHLLKSVHPGILVKEIMVIFQSTAPMWFKKQVSKSLTNIIRSKDGVENIAIALLGGSSNDSTQTWKILDVFSKLILSCRTFPDFEENICHQLIVMLDKVTDDSLVFERLFTHCTKSLFQVDQTVNIFVSKIVNYFTYFTNKTETFSDGNIITKRTVQHIRLADAIFIENIAECPSIPLGFLKPVASVIFRFYLLTINTTFKATNAELQEILKALLTVNINDLFTLFDCFLFGMSTEEVLPFREDVELKVEKENIVVYLSKHSISYSIAENSEGLLTLLKNKTDFTVKLFGYLLNCLTEKDKYFKKANENLLSIETEFMNEYVERSLVVYKLLSDLAEDETIQKYIAENPTDIIKYVNNVLKKTIQASTHKTTDFEMESFRSVFTIIMILQQLLANSSGSNLEAYKILIKPLKVLFKETLHSEMKDLIRKILSTLEEGKSGYVEVKVEETKSELDKAIEDICDPLLPVQGHGLVTLTKLIEKKEKTAMERKQYILNIFQQNLKNEDSFIYLSAIAGLAAMADVFPDTVINVLCEEYSDSSRKNNDDGHEDRMKLGESLVRVTKILGDMAPKYKPLLLNTFLLGARDDDHLIRASSLSNLGEICRVLGYKLGTIVTEVLVCVHAIIATDKSLEARRAAVTVIRQLFAGLDNEIIAFLKDDILPIYRTLKDIYNNDKDDVMRLQAQLALEELNENMKNFMFPKPQLNTEKRIIMLN